MTQTTAAGRYKALEADRQPFLDRARDCSKLTIPTLIPPDDNNAHTKFYTPFQGLGARGVNNLASKLLLALMPPNSPFFRLTIDEFTLDELTQQEGMEAEIDEALGKIERVAMSEIETQAFRVTAGEALKHLIVGGNGLLYMMPEGGLKFFSLSKYVTKRDPSGNVMEIVVKESVAPNALPKSVQNKLKDSLDDKPESDQRALDIYTHITRGKDKWNVYQEVKGEVVPGSKGTYPLGRSPWIPLRFTKVDGEDYGRGYIEEYYGDLRSLENLVKAIVEGSAAAAKVLFLVNPNGVTKTKVLAESESGDVRTGDANDISVVQLEKYADFRVAKDTIEAISQRLSFAFLLNTAVQRGGERVTAEEIRYMAKELEDALGGVYSVLSQEFQLPLIQRLLHQLQRKGRIPELPDGVVLPAITTGLEALGRGHDLNKLDVFISGAMQTFGPEVLSQYLNVGDYLTRRGTALGINMDGLVRSEQEVQQMIAAQQQQAQQAAMGQMMAQGGMDMAKEVVKEGVKQSD